MVGWLGDANGSAPVMRPTEKMSDTLTGQIHVQIPRSCHCVRWPLLPKQNVAGSNPVSRSKSRK
jgi:hypothetical protein